MTENNKWGGYTPNNIYNVDAYEAIKEIPDASIDCIYVDIPYLYELGGGKNTTLSKSKNQYCSEIEYFSNGINYDIFDEFIRISKGLNLFIWCSRLQLPEIMNYFITKNDYLWDLLVWTKTNSFPTNRVWLSDVEYCLYFRQKGLDVGANDYQFKSKWFTLAINQKDKEEYDHPTIKPLELVKRHLNNVTKEGDVVLDCFMGSGTTAVACKELGRNYIGFEINPEYYQIAIDRVNGITQQDKRLKEKGIMNIFDFLDS